MAAEAAGVGRLHIVRRVRAEAAASAGADRQEVLAAEAAGLAVEAAVGAMSHPAAVAVATAVAHTVGVTKFGFLAGKQTPPSRAAFLFSKSARTASTNLGASGFHDLVTDWSMIASHYLGNDATQSTHGFSSLYHSCFRIALVFGD